MVRIRWRIVVLITVLVAAIGATLAFRQPRQFVAEARLVLDVRPDLVLGNLGSAASMITQLEILKTEKVGLRAVHLMGLHEDPAHQEEWRRTAKDPIPLDRWLASILLRGLTAEAVRGSNIISVTYAANDPAFAIRAVNAITKAASEVALELNVEPARESAAWFDAQAKNGLRVNLENAQARLARFQQENGIVFADDKMTAEQARLLGLESQLAAALTEHAAALARERVARAGDQAESQRSALAVSLSAQISAAEARLAEVSGELGPQHPRLRQLEVQIGDLKAQLARENARTATVVSNDARAIGQKVAELRGQIEQQKRQVLAMRSQRDEMSVLQRDVEAAQRIYDGASNRASQLALEGQSKQAGVRVLNLASEAPDTSGRKLYIRLAASLAGALLLGVGTAVALEMFRRRVRHAEDLEHLGVAPLLGVLDASPKPRPAYRWIRVPPAPGGLIGHSVTES